MLGTAQRRDARVNAFSLLRSGKGTPDMQGPWGGGHISPDSTAGLASRLPLPHTPPTPSTSPAASRSCLHRCCWKHIT